MLPNGWEAKDMLLDPIEQQEHWLLLPAEPSRDNASVGIRIGPTQADTTSFTNCTRLSEDEASSEGRSLRSCDERNLHGHPWVRLEWGSSSETTVELRTVIGIRVYRVIASYRNGSGLESLVSKLLGSVRLA